jgi:N4-gp56 family major capsid protein
MFDFMWLQFFADAGTNVNATAAMVNAYNGNAQPRGNDNKMSDELKDFYDTELLENARTKLVYSQFGKKQRLPRRHNGTVEWRKWNTFARASQLAEGVIPTGQDFGASHITGSVDQFGTYTSITDKLELQAFDDIIMGATEEMGASAAETQEALTRNALLVNTNVLYCDNVNKATGAKIGNTPTSTAAMGANDTDGWAILTPTMVNKAATILKKGRAPLINGKYVAVIHPSVAYNLRESDGWIEAHKYAATVQLFNGEIGELHGVRFIEDVDAPVLRGEDLASDAHVLRINNAQGYTGAITSVAFDGGTVAGSALVGRKIAINGVEATVTANTTSAITFASTNFGTIANDAVIYPVADYGAYDNKDGGATYATYFFGKDAFGIIDPEGGALEMIIHDKDEIGGPLNQFSTIGYKFMTNGATILYPERMLRVMSVSDFSDGDDSNY